MSEAKAIEKEVIEVRIAKDSDAYIFTIRAKNVKDLEITDIIFRTVAKARDIIENMRGYTYISNVLKAVVDITVERYGEDKENAEVNITILRSLLEQYTNEDKGTK